MFILQTVLEFSVAGFIIWGLFNEQKLIKFEDRIFDFIKRHTKSSAKKRNVYRHESRCQRDDRTCA
jgi:hypothetical protein